MQDAWVCTILHQPEDVCPPGGHRLGSSVAMTTVIPKKNFPCAIIWLFHRALTSDKKKTSQQTEHNIKSASGEKLKDEVRKVTLGLKRAKTCNNHAKRSLSGCKATLLSHQSYFWFDIGNQKAANIQLELYGNTNRAKFSVQLLVLHTKRHRERFQNVFLWFHRLQKKLMFKLKETFSHWRSTLKMSAGRWDKVFGSGARAAQNCDILQRRETILRCPLKMGPAMFISVTETMSRCLRDSPDFLRC